jgi:hypothetical protein
MALADTLAEIKKAKARATRVTRGVVIIILSLKG